MFLAVAALAGCGTVPTLPPVAPSPQAPSVGTRSRNPEMLFQALAALGTRYRWGGASYANGFDCSGLVAYVYREAYGMILPHNSFEQAQMGVAVDRSELQPGDLVFFNTQNAPHSHVGIYLGDGRFIHAPKTGSVVRTARLNSPYWAARFDGARRILPNLAAAK